MESTNPISTYLNENFYAIYSNTELEDITKADLILIAVTHTDIRFQEIYQNFINLFPSALALIENMESGCSVKNEECEMSWGIKSHITVRGWNNADHMNTIRKECPNTAELSKIIIKNIYQMKVKKKEPEIDSNSKLLAIGAFSETLKKSSIEKQNYSICQDSMLKAIKEGFQQQHNDPVILIGGYLHVKISPNGYKHPRLASYVQEQLKAQQNYQIPFPENNSIVGNEPAEKLPEPKWRQKFNEMFKGKKIVLLVDKSMVIALDKLDKTVDYAIHKLENKLF